MKRHDDQWTREDQKELLKHVINSNDSWRIPGDTPENKTLVDEYWMLHTIHPDERTTEQRSRLRKLIQFLYHHKPLD